MHRGVSRCCQELWPQGQLKEPRSREARGWRPPTMRPLDREHVGKGQTRGQHTELELGRSCRRLRRWRLQNQRLGPRRLFGGHERRHSIDPTSPYGSMCTSTLWHQLTHTLLRSSYPSSPCARVLPPQALLITLCVLSAASSTTRRDRLETARLECGESAVTCLGGAEWKCDAAGFRHGVPARTTTRQPRASIARAHACA